MVRFSFISIGLCLLICIGCSGDPCEDGNCGDHGTCVAIGDATICECDPEWEKDANGNCDFYKLDNFPGMYTVAETCTLDLTSQEVNRSYSLQVSIISQLNRELAFSGINKRSCSATSQPLEVEGVVSNTTFAFKTIEYCSTTDSRFVLTQGSGALNEDGTYSINYRFQYYEFGTILAAETCQATLTPQ